MKDTFIIRTEWKDAISTLTLEQQGQLLQNLFAFHAEEENLINLKNPMVNLVWLMLKPSLVRNIETYDKRKSTSRTNGAKGGRPPKQETGENQPEEPKNNLNKPNKPTGLNAETQEPTETLLVSVSDSVTVSDTVSVLEGGGVLKKGNAPHVFEEKIFSPKNKFQPPDFDEVKTEMEFEFKKMNQKNFQEDLTFVANKFFTYWNSQDVNWKKNNGLILTSWRVRAKTEAQEFIHKNSKSQSNAAAPTFNSRKLRPLGVEPSTGGGFDDWNPNR